MQESTSRRKSTSAIVIKKIYTSHADLTQILLNDIKTIIQTWPKDKTESLSDETFKDMVTLLDKLIVRKWIRGAFEEDYGFFVSKEKFSDFDDLFTSQTNNYLKEKYRDVFPCYEQFISLFNNLTSLKTESMRKRLEDALGICSSLIEKNIHNEDFQNAIFDYIFDLKNSIKMKSNAIAKLDHPITQSLIPNTHVSRINSSVLTIYPSPIQSSPAMLYDERRDNRDNLEQGWEEIKPSNNIESTFPEIKTARSIVTGAVTTVTNITSGWYNWFKQPTTTQQQFSTAPGGKYWEYK